MVKKKRGLGRGLSALIPDEPKEEESKDKDQEEEKIVKIKISEIKPNKNQPRQSFDKESLRELAESIEKVGIIQPIVVKRNKSGFEIIAGERRFRAAKLIGLDTVPSIIREEDERKTAEMALVENIQREDLNPIEEAIAYNDILGKYSITQQELSKIVGKSRTYIANVVRLLNLSDKVKEMIKNQKLTAGHGRALLPISGDEEQYKIALSIVENNLSVRETEKLINDLSETKKEKKKKEKTKDPITKEIEESLRKVLGTKVTINKGRKKGKIEIEYYSDDDLERILELLKI